MTVSTIPLALTRPDAPTAPVDPSTAVAGADLADTAANLFAALLSGFVDAPSDGTEESTGVDGAPDADMPAKGEKRDKDRSQDGETDPLAAPAVGVSVPAPQTPASPPITFLLGLRVEPYNQEQPEPSGEITEEDRGQSDPAALGAPARERTAAVIDQAGSPVPVAAAPGDFALSIVTAEPVGGMPADNTQRSAEKAQPASPQVSPSPTRQPLAELRSQTSDTAPATDGQSVPPPDAAAAPMAFAARLEERSAESSEASPKSLAAPSVPKTAPVVASEPEVRQVSDTKASTASPKQPDDGRSGAAVPAVSTKGTETREHHPEPQPDAKPEEPRVGSRTAGSTAPPPALAEHRVILTQDTAARPSQTATETPLSQRIADIPEKTQPAAQPSPGISLSLGEPGSQRVEIRVQERQGAVQVAVRSGDPALTNSLRGDLHELVTRLESRGYNTETWTPTGTSPVAHPAPAAGNQQDQQHAGGKGDSGNGGAYPGDQNDGGQKKGREDQRPRWLEEWEFTSTPERKSV